MRIGPLLALAGVLIAGKTNAFAEFDPYADRVTERPLALPAGIAEVAIAADVSSSTAYEQTPIETTLAARYGFGPVQVHGDLELHTRYDRTDMRPTLARSVTLGADAVITPLLTAGAELRVYHPFGGDIEQGYDGDLGVSGKVMSSPNVAFVGTVAGHIESRKTRGQTAASRMLGILGVGAVQIAPRRNITIEAGVRLRLQLSGELYGDTALVDLAAGITGAVHRRFDLFLTTGMTVVPLASDERTLLAGVTCRLP